MKKNIFLESVLLFLIVISFSCLAREQIEEKDKLYPQLCSAVIQLEHYEIMTKEGAYEIFTKKVADGTAFFVVDTQDLFIVSARHVVEKEYDLHARVECKNNLTGENEVVLLKLKKNKWIFHPEGETIDKNYVDVAVLKIPWITDRNIYAFRHESPSTDETNYNQHSFEDPIPPDCILILGFPFDIGFELIEQKPLIRSGIISMVNGKRLLKLGNGKFAEEKTILIDAQMFPGNSGSPVIKQIFPFASEIKLLGLVIATNDKKNYAVIEPVSRIRETIEIAKKESKEKDCWFLLEE